MNYGLQLTQREEWQEKHKLRFFLEERIVEIHDMVSFLVLSTFNTYDFVTVRLVEEVTKNKKFIAKALITILVIAIMLI